MGSCPPVQACDFALERRWSVVEAKLAASADMLAEQGTLVAMTSASKRRVWVLRFADMVDGRRVHRSIYIASDDQSELLRRTQFWLDHTRVTGRVAREVEGYARLAASACTMVRRLYPRLNPRRS